MLGQGLRSAPWLRPFQGASCYSMPGQVISAALQLLLDLPVALAIPPCSYVSNQSFLEKA